MTPAEALAVACPRCKRAAGTKCWSRAFTFYPERKRALPRPHAARIKAAAREEAS